MNKYFVSHRQTLKFTHTNVFQKRYDGDDDQRTNNHSYRLTENIFILKLKCDNITYQIQGGI